MPSILAFFMKRGFFKSYGAVIIISLMYHIYASQIKAQNTSIKPFFLYIFKLKNLCTMVGIMLYWLTEGNSIGDDYIDSD